MKVQLFRCFGLFLLVLCITVFSFNLRVSVSDCSFITCKGNSTGFITKVRLTDGWPSWGCGHSVLVIQRGAVIW